MTNDELAFIGISSEQFRAISGLIQFYIRENGKIRLANAEEWLCCNFHEDNKIKVDYVNKVRISTVFTGIDISFSTPPSVFETRISGGACDGQLQRSIDLETALQVHEKGIERVMEAQRDTH